MTAVVFAGPSLHGAGWDAPAGMVLRPPAACGDLLRAVAAGAAMIGLIDGLFENTPSVWHKEILAALDAGVAVYGAASMGALRAAECVAFGMVGVGRIFADYAAGRRVADADVALLHAPQALGYQPLTEPLVDVDATIEDLRERRLVGAGEAEALAEAARGIHYKQRRWPRILAAAKLPGARAAAIESALATGMVRRKRLDAMQLLQRMQADAAKAGAAPERRGFTFQRTMLVDRLRDRVTGARSR